MRLTINNQNKLIKMIKADLIYGCGHKDCGAIYEADDFAFTMETGVCPYCHKVLYRVLCDGEYIKNTSLIAKRGGLFRGTLTDGTEVIGYKVFSKKSFELQGLLLQDNSAICFLGEDSINTFNSESVITLDEFIREYSNKSYSGKDLKEIIRKVCPVDYSIIEKSYNKVKGLKTRYSAETGRLRDEVLYRVDISKSGFITIKRVGKEE